MMITSLVLGGLLSQEIQAEEKGEKANSNRTGLKLLYELTLPECITTYSVKKGKDGKGKFSSGTYGWTALHNGAFTGAEAYGCR